MKLLSFFFHRVFHKLTHHFRQLHFFILVSLRVIILAIVMVLIIANPAMALLRRGDRGPAVTSLQLNLQNAGYSPGVVDGLFGQQTETAVLNFQRDRGLMQDGVVGSTTESALIGKSKGMGGSGQDPYTATTELQQLLTKRGCYSGSIDGIYGPQTTAAVRRAQGVYGLVVDGVAGSATYRALRTGQCNCS